MLYLKKMGVGLGIAIGLASSSQAIVVPVTITPTVDLTNAYILYAFTFHGSNAWQVGLQVGNLSANQTTNFNFDTGSDVPTQFGFIAGNGDNNNNGVTVGMDMVNGAAALGNAFSIVFPGADEDAVRGSLDSDNTDALSSFFSDFDNSAMQPGNNMLVDFSDGTNGGTIGIVPEPCTLVVFGGLVAGVVRRRRKSA